MTSRFFKFFAGNIVERVASNNVNYVDYLINPRFPMIGTRRLGPVAPAEHLKWDRVKNQFNSSISKSTPSFTSAVLYCVRPKVMQPPRSGLRDKKNQANQTIQLIT